MEGGGKRLMVVVYSHIEFPNNFSSRDRCVQKKEIKVDSAQCAVICRNPLAALGVATKALLRSRLEAAMGARRENTVFLTSKCELIVFDAI